MDGSVRHPAGCHTRVIADDHTTGPRNRPLRMTLTGVATWRMVEPHDQGMGPARSGHMPPCLTCPKALSSNSPKAWPSSTRVWPSSSSICHKPGASPQRKYQVPTSVLSSVEGVVHSGGHGSVHRLMAARWASSTPRVRHLPGRPRQTGHAAPPACRGSRRGGGWWGGRGGGGNPRLPAPAGPPAWAHAIGADGTPTRPPRLPAACASPPADTTSSGPCTICWSWPISWVIWYVNVRP